MPIDKQKSSDYLRYLKERSNKTYARINQETGIPNSTLSAYFNGTIQAPNADTFEALMLCIGGSWEEYESFAADASAAPPIKSPEDGDLMKIPEIIETIRETYRESLTRTEAAYAAAIASGEKALRTQRIEKYVLFVLLVIVSVYAVFAFTHYDLQDPTTGITSLLQ